MSASNEHRLTFVGMKRALIDSPSEAAMLTILMAVLVAILPLVTLLMLALGRSNNSRLPPPAGCRKLGLKGKKSNFGDQYSADYAKGADPTPAKPWAVKALFVYPLKSCAPVEMEASDIVQTGLKYDRQFALGQLVTSLPSLEGKVTSEWQFMTQRKFPRLTKVEIDIWVPDPSAPGFSEDEEWVKHQGCLSIRFPFSPDTDFTMEGLKNYGKILAARLTGRSEPMLEFRIPFNPTAERIAAKKYRSEVLRVWNDSPLALNVSPEIDPDILARLKYTLGISNPLALFRINTSHYREVHKCAPKKKDVGFQPIIAMQDSYPVHIINLASVHDVARNLPAQAKHKAIWRMGRRVPLNALRFRANIYITGPPAFHEDDWTQVRVGDIDFHVSCRTTRCQLPGVDPETGTTDRNEPMTTMRRYRVIDKGSKSACLGMQMTPLTHGKIKVGDTLELLQTGQHFFLR